MNHVAAIPIGRVAGSQTTGDGQHFLIHMSQPDGQEIVLAFPRERLMQLVDVAALGFIQCNKILEVPLEHKTAFGVS